MNTEKYKLPIFSVMICAIMTFSSCANQPWDYDKITWFSEEPLLEININRGDDNIGFVYSNGEKLEIEIIWGPTLSFDIVKLKRDPNIPIENVTLLAGRFDYDENKVILYIDNDKLFDNKYPEIVLK